MNKTIYKSDCKDFIDSICEAFDTKGISYSIIEEDTQYVVEVNLPGEVAREILKEYDVV